MFFIKFVLMKPILLNQLTLKISYKLDKADLMGKFQFC